MTEKEKMLAGKLYFAEDEELSGLRRRARNLCHEFNATNEDEKPRRREIIRSLFGHIGRNPGIHPSFHCDYGFPIRAGVNFHCPKYIVIMYCLLPDRSFPVTLQAEIHSKAPPTPHTGFLCI